VCVCVRVEGGTQCVYSKIVFRITAVSEVQ